ncbi:hypothetical protein [Streptomyces sp. CA-132043]|uniref:hypothetical protein n=1 Tax=Streptomyces sp. CA-132043 TaxID=3240048 RepID=UPI003D89F7FD
MDAKTSSAAPGELRAVRDEIKRARATLARLEAERDKRIAQLAGHDTTKAERIARAARGARGRSTARGAFGTPGTGRAALSL